MPKRDGLVEQGFKGIRPNRKLPRICVFDIETKEWVNQFACGFFDGETYMMFFGRNCVMDFVRFSLTNKYLGCKFFAHNGGRFDFNFVIESMQKLGIKFEIVKNNSRILMIQCSINSNRIYYQDSFALLPQSLHKLTHSFNVPHKKLKIEDYENIENENWEEYLMNDVLGLYEVLERFREKFDLWHVGLKTTISQQALSTFRRRMDYEIPCYHDKEWFFRSSYFGGRCLSEDTEILTPDGWKGYNDVKEGDLVCTWNERKNILEYNEVIQKHVYTKDKKMIQIKSDFLDLLVTPDHRMLFRKAKDDYWDACQAAALPDSQISLKVCAKFDGKFYMNPKLSKLLGIVISNGHFRKRDFGVEIYMAKDADIVREVLNELKIKYSEHKNPSGEVGTPSFGKYRKKQKCARFYIKVPDNFGIRNLLSGKRQLNSFLLNMKYDSLKGLFDGLMLGNDEYRKDSNGIRFYTYDKNLADGVQILSLKLGMRALVSRHQRGYFVVNMSMREETEIYNKLNHNIRRKEYSGKTWCVSVKNRNILIRRNGSPCIVGNTEVFKRFGEKLWYYDYVSLYPSVMYDFEMPVGVPVEFDGRNFHEDDIGFAYANVKIPVDACHIPILPFRSKNGKLLFPVGNFSGVWDLDELRKAEEYGYEVEYKYGYKFAKKAMFKEFISDFYSIKEKSRDDKAMYMISKLIMNSAYGKFGQRRECEQIVVNPKPDEMDKMKVVNESLSLFARPTISFAKHILPAIASHITALARLRLFRAFEKCGIDNVYYCDTDSVITSREIESSNKLGHLKLEHKVVRAYMISPKFYFLKTNPHGDLISTPKTNEMQASEENLKNVIRIKGFNMQEYPEECFRKALHNDLSDFHYTALSFGLMSENVRRYGRFVGMIEKKKSIKSLYDKRVVLRNHIDTKPVIVRKCSSSQ